MLSLWFLPPSPLPLADVVVDMLELGGLDAGDEIRVNNMAPRSSWVGDIRSLFKPVNDSK